MMRVTTRWTCVTILLLLACGARAQFPGVTATPQPARQQPAQAPAPITNPASTSGMQNGVFFGSVPRGTPTAEEISVSLADAIQRGLQANLGLLLNEQDTRSARAASLRARSTLLPNLTGAVSETAQQINLAVFGLPPFPGTPSVVGPFPIFDARAYMTASVLDLSALATLRSRRENERAAGLSYQDARDVVVLAVTNLYLQTLAGAAHIDTAQAQLATAQAVYQQAVDMRTAGVVPGIDVLRADVERQTQQQRLIFFRNEWEKQKLRLARAIGMPVEQRFRLADQIGHTPPPPDTPEQLLAESYRMRADYQGAMAAVRAAELAVKAANTQRLPAVSLNANYGDIG